uniref:C3H1-type domain-containing protein n=1 Tax=Chromera velia CCMP2878 TaxID=1169474 RepID=A0A0G4H8I9_9ALVE|eukprot:Cvel_25168.t1-p1 / transcript=Cvel_25168.t1 / gene=Cvel_25168 / organism=Chromera_velia_CCMP2878 / gene_product=Zinc finger CCCH domain-containing protein 8, putative / transcript_product=Zinc finger CCCH domain-containing protein 8, putative / location=Cvel_scaffold2816:14415-18608(+) / protein_length=392 / sequence_SO=supercontig / SO=protein_coding / is_pseudo=false
MEGEAVAAQAKQEQQNGVAGDPQLLDFVKEALGQIQITDEESINRLVSTLETNSLKTVKSIQLVEEKDLEALGVALGERKALIKLVEAKKAAKPKAKTVITSEALRLGDTRNMPCEIFRRGRCRIGERCRFSHDPVVIESQKMEVCKYVAGGCQKGDLCIFCHDVGDLPCRFFHTFGECRKGDQCPFSHSPEIRTLPEPEKLAFVDKNKFFFLNLVETKQGQGLSCENFWWFSIWKELNKRERVQPRSRMDFPPGPMRGGRGGRFADGGGRFGDHGGMYQQMGGGQMNGYGGGYGQMGGQQGMYDPNSFYSQQAAMMGGHMGQGGQMGGGMMGQGGQGQGGGMGGGMNPMHGMQQHSPQVLGVPNQMGGGYGPAPSGRDPGVARAGPYDRRR